MPIVVLRPPRVARRLGRWARFVSREDAPPDAQDHPCPSDVTPSHKGRDEIVSSMTDRRVVVEVLRFEAVPHEKPGSRQAVARWSDGSEGIGLTWYDDEILLVKATFWGACVEHDGVATPPVIPASS
jgi:hypothetical protein